MEGGKCDDDSPGGHVAMDPPDPWAAQRAEGSYDRRIRCAEVIMGVVTNPTQTDPWGALIYTNVMRARRILRKSPRRIEEFCKEARRMVIDEVNPDYSAIGPISALMKDVISLDTQLRFGHHSVILIPPRGNSTMLPNGLRSIATLPRKSLCRGMQLQVLTPTSNSSTINREDLLPRSQTDLPVWSTIPTWRMVAGECFSAKDIQVIHTDLCQACPCQVFGRR